MKKTVSLPAFLRLAAMLFVIAVIVVLSSGSGQAQTPDPGDDNAPRPGIQSQQGPGAFDPSEDNAPRPGILQNPAAPPLDLSQDNVPNDIHAALPDLIITDPGADVMAEVAELTAVSAAYSQAIPASAFTVDGSTRQWFYGFNSAYIYPSGASYCGIAPVYLPQGAQVISVIAYVMDNDATEDVFVYLYAKPLGNTNTSVTMASMGTTGQNTPLQALVDSTLVQPVIDNTNYVYHVGVCLWGADSNQRFYAVQILY